MGYELCFERVQKQLPTSDGQVGRGLHFTNTVLCEAGERALITDGCFLYLQQEVFLFISDVVPVESDKKSSDASD